MSKRKHNVRNWTQITLMGNRTIKPMKFISQEQASWFGL